MERGPLAVEEGDGLLMQGLPTVYQNVRWNRRLGAFNAGVSLVVPLVAMALVGEGNAALNAGIILTGAILCVTVFLLHIRIRVQVSDEILHVYGALRSTIVSKSDVVQIRSRGLYGVACPVLCLAPRVPWWRRRVAVVAMPFTDAELLGVDAPVLWDGP